MGRFTDGSGTLSERDEAAAKAGIETALAEYRWDDLLEAVGAFHQRFPPDAAVEQANVEALRALVRYDDAAAALELAEGHFGDEPWFGGQRLKLTLDRGDPVLAADLAKALRQRFPDFIDGYILGADALRQLRRYDEAHALLDVATGFEPENVWILMERAWLADARARWDELIACTEAVRRTAPDFDGAYRLAFNAYRHLGKTDAAEKLLREAIAVFSLVPWICFEAVEIAQQKMQFDKADSWLLRTMRIFPDDTELAVSYASRPGRHNHERYRLNGTERTITRLEWVLEEFPGLPNAVTSLAETLLQANRVDEAETLLAANFDTVREHSHMATTWAHAAKVRGDFQECALRYRQVTEWFPYNEYAFEGLMIALGHVGDRDEAERVYQDAIVRFPTSLPVLMARAKVAEVVGDFAFAVELMVVLADDYPRIPYLKHLLYALRLKLGESGDQAPRPVAAAVPAAMAFDPKSVMMRCQSIGGTGLGCEFGLVQRHHGAEPLSLLRWGGLPHTDLVGAIRNGFDGLDDAEDIKIETEKGRFESEYILVSKKYNMRFHSFVYTSEIPEEKFKSQMHRRLKFLRQLFLEDLSAGRHLFVRKQETPIPPLEEIDEMYDALSAYGDPAILYAFPETPAYPCGTVRVHRPGVAFGYMDRFVPIASGEISAAAWLQICTRAQQIWQSGWGLAGSLPSGHNQPQPHRLVDA